MAISYPLSLPTSIGIESIELRAVNAVATSQSPFTYKQQIVAHGGQRWEASIAVASNIRRDLAAPWKAFLTALKGQQGTFLLSDPDYATPRGDGTGTPLVNNGSTINAGSFVVGTRYEIATVGTTNWVSIGAETGSVGEQFVATGAGSGTGTATACQTGATLVIDGATADTTGWLKAGDYIQLGSGSSATLHTILIDADSDGSGNVTLEIWPDLRRSPSDNSAVVVNNPKGVFRLAQNISSWSINNSSAYGISFEAVEAIT